MPGLMRGVARTAVVAGTATAVSNRVSRRQANRWAAQDQTQAASQPPPPPAPVAQPEYASPVTAAEAPPDGMNDKLDQLTQLGALKEQGILTEAEFEAQKSKILAG
jgi:hypothetical protein